MNKQEFLSELRKRLSRLPKQEIEERIEFYSEMIDDLTEEGLTEEEAISQIGSVEEIVAQIIGDSDHAKDTTQDEKVKNKTHTKRQLSPWEIVLIALGSPIWLSLLIAAFSVVLSMYVVIWSVVISLWSVFASLIGAAVGGIAAGVLFIVLGNTLSGIAMIGAGIVCAGLSILFFFLSRLTTKAVVWLTVKIALGIKSCFVKKEARYD